MKTEEIISRALRFKRTELNFSQAYMAGKLNISQNSYSKIEAGSTKLSYIKLLQICDVFNIDVSEFLLPVVKECQGEKYRNMRAVSGSGFASDRYVN